MNRKKTIHSEQYSLLIEELISERKRLNLSQTEVGEQLGMTQSEISKIETIERRLDIYEFKQFLNAYRVGENERLRPIVLKFLGLE